METTLLFRKIASGEELSQAEKLQVAKEAIGRKGQTGTFEKLVSGNEVSFDEKIEIARTLIADKVADILQKEMIVSRLSGERAKLTLKARQCTDSDENLRKFLVILGAQDVKVTSDFPCGWGGENYEGTTTIQFNY